jgi:hypothetical protein
MTGADLYEEMKAASFAVRQPHLDRLRMLGVSPSFIADLGAEFFPFGIAELEPNRDGTYDPGAGRPHVIMPVIEDGDLIDLVAWRTATPDDWRLRLGHGWAIGCEHMQAGAPVHVCSSPLDWLRQHGRGLCPLNWEAPELASLVEAETVTVTDPFSARLVARVLRRPVHVPQIEITGWANAA